MTTQVSSRELAEAKGAAAEEREEEEAGEEEEVHEVELKADDEESIRATTATGCVAEAPSTCGGVLGDRRDGGVTKKGMEETSIDEDADCN